MDSVQRVTLLMDLLLAQKDELGIRDIARMVDVPKSTVQRMLSSLETAGWVRRTAETQKYRLGLRFLAYANSWRLRFELVHQTRHILEDLSARTQETVLLLVLDGDCGRCIDKVEPVRTFKLVAEVGKTFPLHAAACGKILLAFSPERVQERVLSQPLERFTPTTIVDAPALREELDRIVARGYARSIEELTPGAAEISVPILDDDGNLIAGLSVAGARTEIEDRIDEMLRELEAAARRILPRRLSATASTGRRGDE
jgi:DNA-binding IclR family transcriptional regulator